MSKINAETPSKAQQKCVGTVSTKPCSGRFATAGGVVRMKGADAGGLPAFCTLLNLTVDFIGESATRAVSLRRPAWAGSRLPTGVVAGRKGGLRPDRGDGANESCAVGGSSGVWAGGAAGGNGVEPAGGGELGALRPEAGGGPLGGRTSPEETGAGGRAMGGAGGRLGRLIRGASFSTGAAG